MSAGVGTATCHHAGTHVTHKMANGDVWLRCGVCGHQWHHTKAEGPTLILAENHNDYVKFLKGRGVDPNWAAGSSNNGGYYEGGTAGVVGHHFKRIVVTEGFRCNREDAGTILAMSRTALEVGGKIAYDGLLPGWFVSKWDVNGDPILHDEAHNLRCNWCREKCNETYRGGFCYSCGKESKMATKKYGPSSNQAKIHPSWNVVKTKPMLLPLNPGMTKAQVALVQTINKTIHNVGDIWELPKANSPMWTQQWGYQGSAKTPYIISKRDEDRADGATTKDGWACSCMSFTRNTPRTPCKHILNVIVKYGLGKVAVAAAKMANVDEQKLKEFEKWQREQAALKSDNKPTAGAKLNLFGATTRKFR